MRSTMVKLLGVLALLAVSVELATAKKYKRVCYYTNWSQYRPNEGKFFPENIDASLCTHIVYAFGKIVNNEVRNFEWNDDVLYGRVIGLKEQNPELVILLAMGGWNAGSLDYSKMVATKETRTAFIDSSISWLRQYNFDGLDMDWEYPARRGGDEGDKVNFITFLKEAKEAFDNEALATGQPRLQLTAAVVAAGIENIDTSYNVPEMSKYLDFIAIMAYDLHGGWDNITGHNSPLYPAASQRNQNFNMAWSAQRWSDLGAPREKLVIGMATYGRTFTLVDAANAGVGAPARGAGIAGTYTRESGFMSYYEICSRQQDVNGNGRTYRDPVSQTPYYVDGTLWIGYDDQLSLYNKVKNVVIAGEYGGIMVWALDLDDFMPMCFSTKYPLITTMNELLKADENNEVHPPPPSSEVPSPPPPPPSTAAPPKSSTSSPGGGDGGDGTGEGFCADKSNGAHADPTNCRNYYNCWGGTGTLHSCQENLYFNPTIGGCDFQENVVCQVK